MVLGLAGALVSCGNICDDAAGICGDAFDAEDAPDDESASTPADCAYAHECRSQCIVDQNSCDSTKAALMTCLAACEPEVGRAQ